MHKNTTLVTTCLALAAGCAKPQNLMWVEEPPNTTYSATDWDTPTAFGPTVRELVDGLDLPAQVEVTWAPGAPSILATQWDLALDFDDTAAVTVVTATHNTPDYVCADDACTETVEVMYDAVVYGLVAQVRWTDPATGLRLTAPTAAHFGRSAMLPTSGASPLWVSETFADFAGVGLPFPESTTYVPAGWEVPASWVPLELPPSIEQALQAAIAPTARLDTLSWSAGVTYMLDAQHGIAEIGASSMAFHVVNTEADPGNGSRLSPLDEVARGTISFAP